MLKGRPLREVGLPTQVQSDHAEIRISTNRGCTIACWNLSNPIHHGYYCTNESFKGTHMAVPEDQVWTHPWLIQKTNEQIEYCAQVLFSCQVQIFILCEATEDFLDHLDKKLNSIFPKWAPGFVIIAEKRDQSNTTALVINQTSLSIKNPEYHRFPSAVITLEPDVKWTDTYQFQIIGAHVSGSDDQYPVDKLIKFFSHLEEKRQQSGAFEKNLIIGGDFNTSGPNLIKFLRSTGRNAYEIREIPYPTHMNPLCEIGVYDRFLTYRLSTDNGISWQVQPLSSVGESSKKYVECLQKATLGP